MKAIAVGFPSEVSQNLASNIPMLGECASLDITPILTSIDPTYSLFVFSCNAPVYDVIERIFDANPNAIVYQQIGHDDTYFVRISRDIHVSDSLIQTATEKVMKVKSLSTKIRHNVRSPIQSIFDSAEKLLMAKVTEDRKQLLDTLVVLQRNASRIYANLESFTEFHKELDSLEETLLQRSVSMHKDKAKSK